MLAGIRQTRPTDQGIEEEAEPHVIGSLVKQGAAFPYSWKRRHFVFVPRTRELKYFEGPTLKGTLTLIGCEVTEADGATHGIYFESEDRMLLACADSDKERKRWMAAVKAATAR